MSGIEGYNSFCYLAGDKILGFRKPNKIVEVELAKNAEIELRSLLVT